MRQSPSSVNSNPRQDIPTSLKKLDSDRFGDLARLNRLKRAQLQDEPQGAPDFIEDEDQHSVPLHLGQAGLQLLFAQPNIHGDYAPQIVDEIRRMRQGRHYVFLAFPPKCGGTFIRSVVGRAAGAGPDPMRPGIAMGGRDVVPYLPMLAAQMLSQSGPKAFMTHAHMVGHHANIQVLNLFGIKPVVMKRSIPDMLCSFAEMVDVEGRDGNGGYNWSILCGVHTDESFAALDREERTDFLVYYQAPWYMQFYASWLRAGRNKHIPVHWIAYDEFRADPVRTITGILDYYGLLDRAMLVPGLIAQAEANKTSLRFNKGLSGRGAAFLKPRHLEHLHRLAGGYPDIDFVAEGLLPPVACC